MITFSFLDPVDGFIELTMDVPQKYSNKGWMIIPHKETFRVRSHHIEVIYWNTVRRLNQISKSVSWLIKHIHIQIIAESCVYEFLWFHCTNQILYPNYNPKRIIRVMV